jgi:peptidoglycan hydrolase-like protein with peptidoglycan-binding domain
MKKLILCAVLFSFLFNFQPALANDDLKARLEEIEKAFSLIATSAGFGEMSVPEGFRFVNNLKMGSIGDEVRYLQIVLNSDNDTKIADSGIGSSGQETIYFGPATHRAVVRFQEKHASEVLRPIGLTTGTGVVGSLTRTKLNKIIGSIDPGSTSGNDILKVLLEIQKTIKDLKERLDKLEIPDPDNDTDAKGEIDCSSSTTDSITVSYTVEDATNASLFRGTTRVKTIGRGDNDGTHVDRNLSAGTSYRYYLYDGLTSSSARLDTVSCSTKQEPTTEGNYYIKSVAGEKKSYIPKEAMNMIRVEAVDSKGGLATPARGFTVKANIYSGSDLKRSANATYIENIKKWEFSTLAPEEGGFYRLEIVLDCSGGNKDCASYAAGGNAKKIFYFTVQDVILVVGTGLQARTIDLTDGNWANAKKQCEDLGNGWQLPTINQLKILYSKKVSFGGFRNKNYWSRTTDGEDKAKIVNFNNGDEGSAPRTIIGPSVRCVRVFSVVEVPGANFSTRAFNDGAGTWEYAKEYCESLGWKLPTLVQMRTMRAKQTEIGGFLSQRYWTVNKPNENEARTINVVTGLEEVIPLNRNIAFRCIKEN